MSSNRVPEEVDMGLDLIEFVDLKRSATGWSDIIISKLNYDSPGKEEIVKQLRKRGYDICDSVKRLERVYDKDVSDAQNGRKYKEENHA